VTWDELYRQKGQIVLPLAGDDAFTLQYASTTNIGEGDVSLELTTTTLVLNFFKRARDLGLIDDSALTLKNAEDSWSLFAKSQVAFAQVSTAKFLSERDKVPDAQFALVPTRDGKSATPVSGWAFAMTTNDPSRQAAAARFIQWLMASDRLTTWVRAAHHLSPSRSMMNSVVTPAEYATFLRDLLERGIYVPRTPANEKIAAAWRTAIAGVMKNQITPDEAARTIVNASK
jgi:ABC-type glycerol-3-phosphate transport system substrate-binding protein